MLVHDMSIQCITGSCLHMFLQFRKFVFSRWTFGPMHAHKHTRLPIPLLHTYIPATRNMNTPLDFKPPLTLHAYIQEMHTWHTCMHICMHVCMHACKRTYIHSFIHTYIHAYMHRYMHTYIHTYMHTYMQTPTCVYRYLDASIHTFTFAFTCGSTCSFTAG